MTHCVFMIVLLEANFCKRRWASKMLIHPQVVVSAFRLRFVFEFTRPLTCFDCLCFLFELTHPRTGEKTREVCSNWGQSYPNKSYVLFIQSHQQQVNGGEGVGVALQDF